MPRRPEITRRPARSNPTTEALARGLGWFSIALGLAEVAAPRALARALGMQGYEPLIAAYGVREIGKGIGILASADPTPWVWGRVAGDALDLATLATGLEGDNPKRGNVLLAVAAVAGATALDVYCAQALSADSFPRSNRMRDNNDRRDTPRPADATRGVPHDFEAPSDFRTPQYRSGQSNSDHEAEAS